MGQKVFVGNMSFDTTREELQELFAQAGEFLSLGEDVLHCDSPRGIY